MEKWRDNLQKFLEERFIILIDQNKVDHPLEDFERYQNQSSNNKFRVKRWYLQSGQTLLNSSTYSYSFSTPIK